MSDADRWAVVERIYHEAVERPVADRPAFLESACAGDVALRRELESLLATDGASLLDKSALDVAAREMTPPITVSWVGRAIRHYEVVALIGIGGMGEVYRARDRSLGREVALKLLPQEVSKDPERLRRLEREARILASLNHAGIATLFGLEAHDGQRFLVMELVPGQTLAERVRHGSLPIRDALDICRQIAEGLEAAHDAGVVHRDLKPSNVKVTPDGRVKLLDFGLAKAVDPTPGGVDPTLTASEATREGTVLGTPAYMSPEQARGQQVDRRADIWAFGCCLYECLTGRSAFKGNTVTDTLAAVLDKDPDWSSMTDAIPPGVKGLLRRCLVKDVRHRLQHIGDARLELEEAQTASISSRASRSARPRSMTTLAVLVLLLSAALSVTFWMMGSGPRAPSDQIATYLTVPLTEDQSKNRSLLVGGFFVPFALSPDGRRIVFRARELGSQLFLRDLSGFDIKPLAHTDVATTPFFSPDGRWIGFWRAEDRLLWKLPSAGGSAIEIGSTNVPMIALWRPNDEIVFDTAFPKKELWSIQADGGTPQPIAVRDRADDEGISLRALGPGTDELLLASTTSAGTWLDVLSRSTGKRRRLLRGGSNAPALFTKTGHLVYSDGDTLFAVPVDERSTPVAPSVPILHGIDHYWGHANVAFAENGTVVFLPVESIQEAEIAWLDRQGKATPVPGGTGPFGGVALSPDGTQAAVTVTAECPKCEVWILNLARGTKRLLRSEGSSSDPIWSRDGAFVTYVSTQGDAERLYRTRADGAGGTQMLARVQGFPVMGDWSPDGQTLLFTEYAGRGDSDIWMYSRGKVSTLVESRFNESAATFSRDGRIIAFEADDGGVSHIYVQPFPGPGPRTTVSSEEGDSPRWSADGRQLLYWSGPRLMEVEVHTRPVVQVGQSRIILEDRSRRGHIDVAPDGQRFLTFTPRSVGRAAELRLILNGFEELERRAPHPH